MKQLARLSFIVILLISALGLTGAGAAQSTDEEYFPETGHTVRGEFLRLYRSTENALRLFGYPITDEFYDPNAHLQVQYFQKARFDLVQTPDGLQARVAPLGERLYTPDAPLADIAKDGGACRSFPPGNHKVCYAFLQFYESDRHADLLGAPISEVEIRENRLVQYFQNGRLEYRSERPNGEKVVVTDLGRIYFEQFVNDPSLLLPHPPAIIEREVLRLKVSAFVQESLVRPHDQQTLTVIVLDQYLRAVPNAQVAVTLRFPDGRTEFVRATETNTDGVSRLTFTVGDLPYKEMVEIAVDATGRGAQAKAATWFRIWW